MTAAGSVGAAEPEPFTPPDPTEALAGLGLPRTVNPVCIIPIGWAKGRYGTTTRRPIGEVVHHDHYGNQPFG